MAPKEYKHNSHVICICFSYRHQFPITILIPHVCCTTSIWSNIRRCFYTYCNWFMPPKRFTYYCQFDTFFTRSSESLTPFIFQSELIVVFIISSRYFLPLMLFFCFIMPTTIPTLWGESLWNAYFIAAILRYCLLMNSTWLVNSAAHLWGSKPYDRSINPVENALVSTLTGGEGWHNYHHAFPWDYRAGEFGWRINPTTMFIDLMAVLGQVTDRKTTSRESVKSRKLRTG